MKKFQEFLTQSRTAGHLMFVKQISIVSAFRHTLHCLAAEVAKDKVATDFTEGRMPTALAAFQAINALVSAAECQDMHKELFSSGAWEGMGWNAVCGLVQQGQKYMAAVSSQWSEALRAKIVELHDCIPAWEPVESKLLDAEGEGAEMRLVLIQNPGYKKIGPLVDHMSGVQDRMKSMNNTLRGNKHITSKGTGEYQLFNIACLLACLLA